MVRTHRFYAEIELSFSCTYHQYQLLALLTINSHFCDSRNRPKELFVNAWWFFCFSLNLHNQLEQKSFWEDRRGEAEMCVFSVQYWSTKFTDVYQTYCFCRIFSVIPVEMFQTIVPLLREIF